MRVEAGVADCRPDLVGGVVEDGSPGPGPLGDVPGDGLEFGAVGAFAAALSDKGDGFAALEAEFSAVVPGGCDLEPPTAEVTGRGGPLAVDVDHVEEGAAVGIAGGVFAFHGADAVSGLDTDDGDAKGLVDVVEVGLGFGPVCAGAVVDGDDLGGGQVFEGPEEEGGGVFASGVGDEVGVKVLPGVVGAVFVHGESVAHLFWFEKGGKMG